MNKRLYKIFNKFFRFKIWFYENILSNASLIDGKAKINQPTLFLGEGQIVLAENVMLGYFPSPCFYSGYIHIEARDSNSSIKIGANTIINNNFAVIASKASVTIGEKCLFGTNIEIMNSDFHNIEPEKRHSGGGGLSADVNIGNNVWIGNSVKILKGVAVGDNSIIAAGAIVTKNVPENTIVAGNPAKEIRKV